MKAQLAALALSLLASNAFASDVTINCSSPDGATTIRNTFQEEGLYMTTENVDQDGEPSQFRFRVEPETVETKILKEKKVSEKSSDTCDRHPGEGHGWYTRRTVSYRHARFTKTDGTLFSEGTIGVSEDRKSVHAEMICETIIGGETECQP